MGYKDQKVIRDTRDAKAAAFIGQTGQAFKRSIAQGATRRKEEQKAQKEMQQKAQAAVSGRYKQAAEYERTGNKSLDEQVIAELENAARLEADLHMKAFGPEATTEDLTMYQKTVANNNRDLNDLTMFVGSFDKDVDAAAAAIAAGEKQLPGGGDFLYELAVQQGAPIKLGRGKDGRYSIFGAEDGEFADKEIQLGKYYDDFEASGTRYPMIDRDYNLVTDEWAKSLLDPKKYVETQQTGTSTVVSTGSEDGGKVKSQEPGKKGKFRSIDKYKTDIVEKLKDRFDAGKNVVAPSIKGAPELSVEQLFYNNLGGMFPNTEINTYEEWVDSGGEVNDLFEVIANNVATTGSYAIQPASDLVFTNLKEGAVTETQPTKLSK